MSKQRFEITASEGTARGIFIVIDKKTSVNYIVTKFGVSGGITPLLNSEGKPVITPIH